MSGNHKVEGVCPVCGKVHVNYHPPLPFGMTIEQSNRWNALRAKYPISVWKCYHSGTSFHDDKNYSASAGTLVPMHLFFAPDFDPHNYHRVFPNANDDCNKRHWKV